MIVPDLRGLLPKILIGGGCCLATAAIWRIHHHHHNDGQHHVPSSYWRPRLWFLRTLVQLKWNMFRVTGDSSISGQRITSFQPEFDPRFNAQALALVKYAVKQLIGINEMWWIMYAFVPFFTDDIQFGHYGFVFRTMITQFVMQPRVLLFGDRLDSIDAAHLLEYLQRESTVRVVEEAPIPVMNMKVNQGDPIPVTYIPMDTAICFDEPPEYEHHRYRTQLFDPTKGDGFSPIPIFVSHQWSTPDNPNRNDDFKRLLMLISFTIHSAIQACIILLRNNFPLDQLVLQQGSKMRRAFRLNLMFIYNEDNLDPEYMDESGKLAKLPQVSGLLARDIFKEAARQVLIRWDGETLLLYECHRAVMQRIWLWYDYCCLPQKPNRNTAEMVAIFKSTLNHLPELQRRGHTVAMNVAGERYFSRAWCFSEYTNMDSNTLDGRSEYGHVMARFERKTHADNLPFRIFELLIDPSVALEEVLSRVGLSFTNSKHSENQVTQICWILWNSILRRKMFFYDYYFAFEYPQRRLFIGAGSVTAVIQWLKLLHEALSSVFDPEQRMPFLEAMNSCDDLLSYDISTWSKKRAAAFEERVANSNHDIVVSFVDDESDDNPNAVADAIEQAQGKLRELDATDFCKLWIRNDGVRDEDRPHLSLLFYDNEMY